MSFAKPKNLTPPAFAVLALLALVLGAWYRFPDLGLRPMHLDEAILGIKFADFWAQGWFDYDPKDYHGPFLHYLTRFIGYFLGWDDSASISDSDLRFIIALTGTFLILLTLALTDVLGRHGTVMAMLLVATSPMMVFYSRYYIMELPFVVLLMILIICVWRYHQSKAKRWLILAGIAIGALHATKETFVINLAAMGGGWLLALIIVGGFGRSHSGLRLSFGAQRNQTNKPWLWVCLVAVVTSISLYSGFFRHWHEVRESVETYGNYLTRSGGAGHEKPWYYYISLLAWQREYFLWTELATLILSALGIIRAFFGWFNKETHKQSFLVFLSGYALLSLLAYSVIPYKTPWTILSVDHALILLAGAGFQWLMQLATGKLSRGMVTLAAMAAIYHLCLQTMQTLNYRGAPNMRAPYVYSHTSLGAMKLVRDLRDIQRISSENFKVQVVNADSGWPLGWYFRDIAANVGYHTTLPATLPDVPIYIVDEPHAAKVTAMFPNKKLGVESYSLREGFPVIMLIDQTLNNEWRKYRGLPPLP